MPAVVAVLEMMSAVAAEDAGANLATSLLVLVEPVDPVGDAEAVLPRRPPLLVPADSDNLEARPYPSQKPCHFRHRWQNGLASSHLTWRFLGRL